MHTRIGKALEGRIGLLGEVHHAWNHDRGGAVFQQIHFLRELCIMLDNLAEQIVNTLGDTVALRLACDDHDIEL